MTRKDAEEYAFGLLGMSPLDLLKTPCVLLWRKASYAIEHLRQTMEAEQDAQLRTTALLASAWSGYSPMLHFAVWTSTDWATGEALTEEAVKALVKQEDRKRSQETPQNGRLTQDELIAQMMG